MSLTSAIATKGAIYQALRQHINIEYCAKIVQYHNEAMARSPILSPVQGTDFPLVGMAAIYAFRDYLGVLRANWDATVAAKTGESYPSRFDNPAMRALYCALLDKNARAGVGGEGRQFKGLPANLTPSLHDLTAIVKSFGQVWGNPSEILKGEVHLNPTFDGSGDVGGADANLIIGDTLIDIRTSAKRHPMTLDNVIQQCGYVLLDYEGDYGIKQISWYYTRQRAVFTHPVRDLICDFDFESTMLPIVCDREANALNYFLAW